jgi:hypothetical protein
MLLENNKAKAVVIHDCVSLDGFEYLKLKLNLGDNIQFQW